MGDRTLWQRFLETGAPEDYLQYKAAVKAGVDHVSEDPRACPAGDGV